MSVRAVVFDVYQTLLEVLPAPADAERRWQKLWARLPGAAAAPSLDEFAQQVRRL